MQLSCIAAVCSTIPGMGSPLSPFTDRHANIQMQPMAGDTVSLLDLHSTAMYVCGGQKKQNMLRWLELSPVPLGAMLIPDFVFKLALTFALAFAFGLERQRSHKPIGFGTFVFVSTGGCGIGALAILLTPSNPLPLLGAIVTGVGFLGAGALIKTGDKVYGFTSAALIWIFAVFGMIIGVGRYGIGIGLYLFIWLVILADSYLEKRGIGAYQKKLTIHANGLITQEEIENLLVGISRYKLVGLEVNKTANRLSITYSIEARQGTLEELTDRLTQKEWFDSYIIE